MRADTTRTRCQKKSMRPSSLGAHARQAGAKPADIEAVRTALRALYDDRLPCVEACRIVQDADRLDKLGALGVAAFSPRQRCADAASPTR